MKLDDLNGVEREFERHHGGDPVAVQHGLRKVAWVLAKRGDDVAARQFMAREQELSAGADEGPEMAQLGLRFEEIMRFDLVIECYEQARATGRQDPGYWYYVHNNHACCLSMLKRFAEAESLAREAISIDPDRHNAHKNLGLALLGQGRLQDAAESFRRARDLRPSDGRAAQYLAAIEGRKVRRQLTCCRRGPR